MFVTDDLRIGEIEAVTTPPPILNPQRQSTQLFIDYGRNSSLPIPSNELTVPRVVSQGSLLPTPITPDAARSSYMTSGTDTSRMSGLSDFPSPPAHVPPLPQLSSEHIPLPPRPNESQFHLDVQRPRISREDSHDTFGARSEYSVGQAL